MKHRYAALAAVPLLLLLVGCSQVQDVAQDVASDAASQAASAAADRVQEEICTAIGDGQISEQDQTVLSGLLVGAEASWVPAEFVTPLEDIAQAARFLASAEAGFITGTVMPVTGGGVMA